ALPIWINYMRTALDGVAVKEQGPLPDGLERIDGNYYFAEFPPGSAIARIGLPSPYDEVYQPRADDEEDGISQLLRSLDDDNQDSGHRSGGAQIRPVDPDPDSTPGLIPFSTYTMTHIMTARFRFWHKQQQAPGRLRPWLIV